MTERVATIRNVGSYIVVSLVVCATGLLMISLVELPAPEARIINSEAPPANVDRSLAEKPSVAGDYECLAQRPITSDFGDEKRSDVKPTKKGNAEMTNFTLNGQMVSISDDPSMSRAIEA